MAQVMKGELYPVAAGEPLPSGYARETTMVRATGEKRVPRKGEWFLSGAIIEGYQATTTGLCTAFHIGELVRGELVWPGQQVDGYINGQHVTGTVREIRNGRLYLDGGRSILPHNVVEPEVWTVQANYGGSAGWEDLTACEFEQAIDERDEYIRREPYGSLTRYRVHRSGPVTDRYGKEH